MASSENLKQMTAPPAHMENDQEIEIDLLGLFYRLVEKWYIIGLAAVVGAMLAWGYTHFMVTPMYTATSALYVVSSTSAINLSDLQLGNYLANDYREVFSNWQLMNDIIQDEELDLDCTISQLTNMISVVNPSNTRLLYITVTHPDPQMAKDLADKVAEHAQNFITEHMSTQKPDVFQKAMLPYRPASPNMTRNVVIGFLLGALIAAAIYVIQFIADDYVRTPDDIEKLLGVSTLGSIPIQDFDKAGSTKHVKKSLFSRKRSSKRK
jgi:capsular polysaccharide biosynthesis protein